MTSNVSDETNMYAKLVKTINPRTLRSWKQAGLNDMWTFIAIKMAMGIDRMSSNNDYCTTFYRRNIF